MTKNKKWVWICCQHPMPLLVQDRGKPDVLERIPPWGDPDLRKYIEKFREVLKSLEKFENFKLDFEISAREMEDITKTDQNLVKKMADLVKKGKIGFVGGDYAQSHCHVFGSESCLRQIIYGLKTFQELFNYKIDVFFHQETGVHDQLPQILKALGYKVAVPPGFPWALEFIKGKIPEITVHYGVVEFVDGEDLTYWEGLDGSKIPLYLSMPPPSESEEILKVFEEHGNSEIKKKKSEPISSFERFMEREKQKNPVNVPRVLIETPDMKRIDEHYYKARNATGVFSLLGDALKEKLKNVTSESTARLFAYWSYIEGVWAESMSRKNKEAEISAIQAEAISTMRLLLTENNKTLSFDRIWKNILSSQHHDVYWIETTDLKRQALEWLEEAIRKSEELAKDSMEVVAARIDTSWVGNKRALVIFNTSPRFRKSVVRISESFEEGKVFSLSIRDHGRRSLDTQVEVEDRWDDGSIKDCELIFLSEVPGLGYNTYSVEILQHLSEAPQEDLSEYEFENRYYRVVINGDGTIPSLLHQKTEKELIDIQMYLGNEIRGLSENHTWITNRSKGAKGTLTRGSVANVFRVKGVIGTIPYEEKIYLYHYSSCIDFSIKLDFGDKGIVLGDFWNDETKLNLYWPVNLSGAIHHDIPFGVIKGKENRPLFCTNWIDISEKDVGITYLNRGTTKHWVRDRTIVNLLAWGGNQFSNRNPGLWENVNKYDIRLYGVYIIECSLYIHSGDWVEGGVPRVAELYLNPLKEHWAPSHKGKLPERYGIFEIKSPNIVTTAVQRGDVNGSLKCRVFETCGREISRENVELVSEFKGVNFKSLSGNDISSIKPYQIVEIELTGD